MARIVARYPKQGRTVVFGITFFDGFAEVDELHPEVAQALTQHGYTIEQEFGVVELADGTVIGDGVSLATLPIEGKRDSAVRPAKPSKGRNKGKPTDTFNLAEPPAETPTDPDSAEHTFEPGE